jgi:hypothetical protein
MKILKIIIMIALLPCIALCQDATGTIKNLELKNGYKSLKLGSDIKGLSPEKLGYLNKENPMKADSTILYEYRDDDLKKVSSDLTLSTIALKVYKGKIAQIILFFNKPDGGKFLDIFQTAFGMYTYRANRFMDNYEWESSSVDLELRYESNSQFGMALYGSNILLGEIRKKAESNAVIQLCTYYIIAGLPKQTYGLKKVLRLGME